MKRLTRSFPVLALVTLSFLLAGCQVLKDASKMLNSLQNLQFRLNTPTGFRVNGIDISRFSQPSQISPLDYASLGVQLAQKKFPVSFTLPVAVRNPNTGSTGTNTQKSSVGLRRFEWTLTVDNRTTINGVVDRLIQIPDDGQTAIVPLDLNLDLYQFFGNNGLTDMLNLALAIGGSQGSASRLKLDAKVTASTPFGDVAYPNAITIIDKQFSN